MIDDSLVFDTFFLDKCYVVTVTQHQHLYEVLRADLTKTWHLPTALQSQEPNSTVSGQDETSGHTLRHLGTLYFTPLSSGSSKPWLHTHSDHSPQLSSTPPAQHRRSVSVTQFVTHIQTTYPSCHRLHLPNTDTVLCHAICHVISRHANYTANFHVLCLNTWCKITRHQISCIHSQNYAIILLLKFWCH